MIAHDKASSKHLAVAFLRKSAGRTRIGLKPREVLETEDAWIFDFYYPDWRNLRKKEDPYGVRVSIDKRTGRAEHYAPIRPKKSPTNQMQRTRR
jgi:hypothetical protein